YSISPLGKALAYASGSCFAGAIVAPLLNVELKSRGWEWKPLMLLAAAFSLGSALISFLFLKETAPIKIARKETRDLGVDMKA
ncbi:hypothetical protein KIPB_015773, partial [Kipferlia bialata]